MSGDLELNGGLFLALSVGLQHWGQSSVIGLLHVNIQSMTTVLAQLKGGSSLTNAKLCRKVTVL